MREEKLCEVCGAPAVFHTGAEETGLWRFHHLCAVHRDRWLWYPKIEVRGPTGRLRPRVWQEVFGRFVAGEKEKLEMFQHVRLSSNHPRVHLASTAITEENKTDSRCTLCGAGLRPDTLLNVKEETTCLRCLAIYRRRSK